MNHIISMILFLILGIFILIDYFKDKKLYRLLAIIAMLVANFFQSPLSNNISIALSNTLIGLLILIMILIFYLMFKEEKLTRQ
ncbi:hypothetical protein [Clostridium frigidicarnis]|uniref:Uncharacterized protein n=1 Tax=Clostridium frigidicarnis TaxID=84698 RepID=A0A1I0V6A4_9CLOT|nr:hypothetical protein [Clostridium frigidicarnis]SFA71613.1 hypothetical protein SAMN04488528_1001172 [Clostridium frigidicarnis]